MSKRAVVIKELAKMVIKSNLENYKQVTTETDELESSDNFRTFGVTDETVLAYMKDILDEVLSEVEEQQSFLADCLYDD